MEEPLQIMVEETGNVYNIKHRAFYLAKSIILFIGKQQYERIYHSLFDQLLRSATSIGANLVEGTAGSTKKDFVHYHSIALKSANETKYWLCLLKETILPEKQAIEEFIKEANEISKIIATIIINCKK